MTLEKAFMHGKRIYFVMGYTLLFIIFQIYFNGWIKLIGSILMFAGIFWAGIKDSEDFEKDFTSKTQKQNKNSKEEINNDSQ